MWLSATGLDGAVLEWSGAGPCCPLPTPLSMTLGWTDGVWSEFNAYIPKFNILAMVILLWAQPLCLRPGSNWVTISGQGRGVWIAVAYSLETPESSLKAQLCNSWLNGPKQTIWDHFGFSMWNSMARSRRAFPFLKLIALRRKVDNFPRDPKLLLKLEII